jgi:ribonuclease P protein component
MVETSRKETLQKQERLFGVTSIEKVFTEGESIFNAPVRLLWLKVSPASGTPVKAAFSVPKRNFKKAVDRNLLKRRMREAYRKNKIIKIVSGEAYHLMFIYTARKINPYEEIASKIVLTLQHFKAKTGAE